MTKKKFISDYTERFGFYMLEGESDGNAVKKVLGEVYDKMKMVDEGVFYGQVDSYIERLLAEKGEARGGLTHYLMVSIAEIIYQKYLSDSNGGDSADTVSEEKSLGYYKGVPMLFSTEEGRQAIRDCIGNQEATISNLRKDLDGISFSL